MSAPRAPGQGDADAPLSGITRRAFLGAGITLGAGLLLGFRVARRPLTEAEEYLDAAAPLTPNGWLHIAPDGAVTVLVDRSEMGQGVLTALPMIVAEELDADWARVTAVHMPVDAEHPIDRGPRRSTGGSRSVRAGWMPLRTAGAQARAVLVQAAAARWGVAPEECRTESGRVLHPASGRALGYGELADDAAKLPLPERPPLKDRKDFRLVGRTTRRLDTPPKVDGSAKYGLDVKVPGMLTAVLARAGTCGGTTVRIAAARAKAVPGVRHVLDLGDAVAVVADGYWAAKKGRDALDVTWRKNGTAVSSAEIRRRLREAVTQPGAVAVERGDRATAPATRVDATYALPFLAHATMEPMNCTAHVADGRVTVWAPTQNQSGAVAAAAEAAGVAPAAVVLHTTMMGGGFGRRLEVDYVTDAVRLSKRLGVPVRVVASREDDMRHDFYRPAGVYAIEGGLDADGWPVVWSLRVAGHASPAVRGGPARDGIDGHNVSGLTRDFPYAVPHYRVTYVEGARLVPTGWWRAVGATMTVFPTESYVDELAAAGKKDPVALRRRLLANEPRLRAVLDLAAERAGWGEPLPAGRGRGIAVASAFGSYVAQVAEVSVKGGQVRVHRVVCAIDCGEVVNPGIVVAQMESGILYGLSAALHGEITFAGGDARQRHFQDYRVVRMHETPAIEVHIVPSSEAPGGVGEPGTPPIAPAVANAIFAATGKRLRDLPLRMPVA